MISIEELSKEVYEDLNGRIVTVTSERSEPYRVAFECNDWNDSRKRRRFDLNFDDVRESTATPSSSGNVTVAIDHPLLWNHNEEHASMYFSSAPEDPVTLIGMLYVAHSRMFRGWRKLSDYLHAGEALLMQGYGQFANGPRRVIEEYARIVDTQCRYTILPGHTPKGGYRAVLFDDCYVVFRGISVVEHAADGEPSARCQC